MMIYCVTVSSVTMYLGADECLARQVVDVAVDLQMEWLWGEYVLVAACELLDQVADLLGHDDVWSDEEQDVLADFINCRIHIIDMVDVVCL